MIFAWAGLDEMRACLLDRHFYKAVLITDRYVEKSKQNFRHVLRITVLT